MMEGASEKSSWFLIHTHPRQEERTTINLQAGNVEPFAPRIREWRCQQFTGERRLFSKHLFARYVFARFDLERMFHKVRYTRGVHEVVSFGDGPVAVEDGIIDMIRSRIDRDGFVRIGDDVQPGDLVVINQGALKDFTGVFEREMKDSERVVVLLNTISYQARIQIDRRLLHKFNDSGCAA